jgi:hypothetical protein
MATFRMIITGVLIDKNSFSVDLCQRKACSKSLFIIFALKYQTN